MSLDFDQLSRIESAVMSQHKRKDITDAEKEVQYTKIFKYFKSLMRHSYEYEKGRNDYSMETHRDIESKEECNRIVKQIINEQSKFPLNRNDQVVTEFTKVNRNHGQKTKLYKFSIRKGKNLPKNGKDMFLGQLLVMGAPRWNEKRADDRKVFISSDVPYCDREKANEMKRTARVIREQSSGNTSYFTRLHVDHDNMDVELLVKKKVGKKSGKWKSVKDFPEEDIPDEILKRYEENVKIKKRNYVPKANRAKGESNTGAKSGASKDNDGGASAEGTSRSASANGANSAPAEETSRERRGDETPSPVRNSKPNKSKGKTKKKKDPHPLPQRTSRRRRGDPPSSEEENDLGGNVSDGGVSEASNVSG